MTNRIPVRYKRYIYFRIILYLSKSVDGGAMLSNLIDRIDDKQSELIELTQNLVRIPTINPPGDAYTPCAEFIGKRLKKTWVSN